MASDRARYAALTAGVIALIVYGSWYPFQFHACAVSPAALLGTSAAPADRGDFLSNILLYLPLGLFGWRALGGSRLALAGAALGGTALSFFIELVQSCDAGRVPSMADVVANGAGALLGAVAAWAVGSRLSFAALLAACWVGTRTLPYLPSLHARKYRAAVHALFAAHNISRLEIFHSFALWLAAAAVVEALAGARRARWMLPALMCAVFAARVVIVDLSLAPAEIAGAAAAALAWNAIATKPWRMAAIATVFAAFIVEAALEPFRFVDAPRPFGWVPFLSFMRGSRESGSRVFLEKSFMYGGLTWLAVRAGVSFRTAAVGAVVLVFALRLCQVYLPGRSAEITDAMMVAMIAALMRLVAV